MAENERKPKGKQAKKRFTTIGVSTEYGVVGIDRLVRSYSSPKLRAWETSVSSEWKRANGDGKPKHGRIESQITLSEAEQHDTPAPDQSIRTGTTRGNEVREVRSYECEPK